MDNTILLSLRNWGEGMPMYIVCSNPNETEEQEFPVDTKEEMLTALKAVAPSVTRETLIRLEYYSSSTIPIRKVAELTLQELMYFRYMPDVLIAFLNMTEGIV